MIAVPEALFEGALIGLDPRAGWVLVRLLSMARGGRVALPMGRPAVDSLSLVAGIDRDCLIAGIELLSALRLIRVADGEISIEIEVSQPSEPDPDPPPRVSKGAGMTSTERSRARRERLRQRDATGCNGQMQRDATDDATGKPLHATAGATGSRGGSRDSDSLSFSASSSYSQKKEREEDRHLDAACAGEATGCNGQMQRATATDATAVALSTSSPSSSSQEEKSSSQEEKSESPAHTPSLPADSAELPKAPSEPPPQAPPPQAPPPQAPELKRGPPQRPQARPDSLTGRPLEIFSALVALSHLWSGLRPSHLAHAAISIDARLKTKEMHSPKPASSSDVSSWLSLAEASVVGADELDPKFDTGPKRLARFEERLEWLTRRWASEPLPRPRQASRGEPVVYDAAADAARILAAPPVATGPRTTVPMSQASLDLKRKLFG